MHITKGSAVDEGRLTTIALALRYGVSTKLLEQWRRYEGFPHEAAIRKGASLSWDHRPVDLWLANRPEPKTGPKPRWRETVEAALQS